MGEQNYTIAIIDSALYVYEEQEVAPGKNLVSGCFTLPVNVQQYRIVGFYWSYGLKIIVPEEPHDDKVLRVPIVKRTPSLWKWPDS